MKTFYKWTFEFEGSGSALFGLSTSGANDDISIFASTWDDIPMPYELSSRHLNSIDDVHQACQQMFDLLVLFNGAVALSGDLVSKLKLKRWLNNHTKEHGAFPQVEYSGQPFTNIIPKKDVKNHVHGEETMDWIYAARTSRSIEHILAYVGSNGLGWMSLCNIVETVEKDGWSEDQIRKAGRDGVEDTFKRYGGTVRMMGLTDDYAACVKLDAGMAWENRLTRQANNATETGIESRHGFNPKQAAVPAKKTLPIEQSRIFAVEAVKAYLNAKSETLFVTP